MTKLDMLKLGGFLGGICLGWKLFDLIWGRKIQKETEEMERQTDEMLKKMVDDAFPKPEFDINLDEKTQDAIDELTKELEKRKQEQTPFEKQVHRWSMEAERLTNY